MGKKKVDEVFVPRDLCTGGRIDDFNIGDTISDAFPENQETLPSINVDEPTMSADFQHQ